MGWDRKHGGGTPCKCNTGRQSCHQSLPKPAKHTPAVHPAHAPCAPQALQINFLDKGMLLGGEGQEEEDAGDAVEAGRRRRLLHSAVERWLRPRAAGIKGLLLMWVLRQNPLNLRH